MNRGSTKGKPRRTTSPRVMFIILLVSNLLASINQSMLNIALDAISMHYNVDLATANWVIIGFAIVAGTMITTAASVLRRWGLRKVMMAGYIISLAGSLIGLFSWNFPLMLVARVLQAITVGLFFPIISAAIMDIAPPGKKATMLSLNSAIIGAALAFSPLIFGSLVTYVSVEACFAVPVAFSVLLIVIAPFTLYDIEQRAKRKIDVLSIAFSFIGLFTFIYGLNTFAKDIRVAIPLMIAGVVFIVLFVIRQNRLEEPLLDLRPLKNLSFSIGELLSQLAFMGSLYMSLLMPLYLEGTAKYTPLVAGSMLVVPILCYAATTFWGGRIEDKRGIWPLMPIGGVILCAGLLVTGFASHDMLVVLAVVGCAITYAGVGFIFAPVKSRDLEAVKPQLVSNASSIHSTMVQVISSVASALFVGTMSADVTRLMAEGATKADAYAAGFSHTIVIEIGIAFAVLICSLFFARVMHKKLIARKGSKVAQANQGDGNSKTEAQASQTTKAES